MTRVLPFFYYITAYSLGIAVLVSVMGGSRSRKDSAAVGFFWATLSMTCTVLVSTLQNYLQLPAESTLSDILSGINYLTAASFSILVIWFFHEVYPWRGARAVNGLFVVVTGALALLTAARFIFPFGASIPDFLLGIKNGAILYTAILAIGCRHRKARTRSMRFTRIIVPVIIACVPIMFLTELMVFKSLMTRFLPGISLRGPWVLPGIYIVWCLSWLAAGVRDKNESESGNATGLTPSEAFCASHGITVRERDVMTLLVQGRSYRDITDALFISLPTVKTHVSNLYRKTGTANRLELAVKAGLISAEADNKN